MVESQNQETLKAGTDISDNYNVLLVGGGRWGKILTKNLVCDPRITELTILSTRNEQGMLSWLSETAQSSLEFKSKVAIKSRDLDVDFLKQFQIGIITNYPREHYSYSKLLLENNINVLVEKPLLLSPTQFRELTNIALTNGVMYAAGLEFMYSEELLHYRSLVNKYVDDIARVEICWADLQSEERHGVCRVSDPTINSFHDLNPHVWSILVTLFPGQEYELAGLEIEEGGQIIYVSYKTEKFGIEVYLSRVSDQTTRRLTVVGKNEMLVKMDFSAEHAKFFIDNVRVDYEVELNDNDRPLSRELSSFVEYVGKQNLNVPNSVENLSELISLEDQGGKILVAKQFEVVQHALLFASGEEPSREVINSLKEHLVLPLINSGSITNPKSLVDVENALKQCFLIIDSLAFNPLCSQKDLIGKLRIEKAELLRLNEAIRHSEFSQKLILEGGLGYKIWANTIMPLVRDGLVDARIEDRFVYPHRVSLFPGLNCMFSCTFCGRNLSAKYENRYAELGLEKFKRMLSSAPNDDPYRFSIGGGLEPLTNPYIGELITFGAQKGYKLSLYTNGFLLNERVFQKQPGLWDLDVLRISLYGADEDSYKETTRKEKAFSRIKTNLIEVLRKREVQNHSTKIGVNFVILPKCGHQVLDLLEFLAEVNKESGTNRKIDFLTLREDFLPISEDEDRYEDREILRKVFIQATEKLKHSDLEGLYVDYGYALYGVTKGSKDTFLPLANTDEILPGGYPQISVVVDSLGDIYLYREAGFIGRDGAERYCLGRIEGELSFETAVRRFIEEGRQVQAVEGDTKFFDIFDHLVTKTIQQHLDNKEFGIPFELGPISNGLGAEYGSTSQSFGIAHPTLAHPTLG